MAWLVVIPDRRAETIADGLMRIFCDCASFPVVLRSDNAAEFVSTVVRHLNQALSIKRVAGSSYHPQSQDAVESMSKTLNQLVRGLVRGNPEKWEESLLHAQVLLRASPMKCLGGRSPYEVVTGLKPRMPDALRRGIPAEELGVDEYVRELVNHLKDVHASVERQALKNAEDAAVEAQGRLNSELFVGDTVLVRREATSTRHGATRFQEKVYPDVYEIHEKISPSTFRVRDLADRRAVLPFGQPLHASRLVRVDLPEVDLRPSQPRRMLMRSKPSQPLNEYEVERFAADGRVQLKLKDGERGWFDLAQCEYSWLS